MPVQRNILIDEELPKTATAIKVITIISKSDNRLLTCEDIEELKRAYLEADSIVANKGFDTIFSINFML